MVRHIEVSILIDQWPNVKIIVNRDGNISQKSVQYDIAATAFEPLVRDAVRLSVDQLIKQRKSQGGQ